MLDAPTRAPSVRLALLAAGAAGSLVALQARLNGQLRVAVDDALLAGVVSFAGGVLVLLVVVLGRPGARSALPLLRGVPWWQRAGGLGGATLIASSAAAAPVVGVALLTLAVVAGQTLGGLLVDRAGLGPGGVRPVTWPRIAGVLLCVLAVVLAAPGGGGEADPVLLGLVMVSGLIVALSSALNGRVNAATGQASVTTLLNFLVGLVALLVALAGLVAVTGLPSPDWPGPAQWYLYTGGLMGAVFVAVASVVVSTVGVLRLGLAVVAGQVSGALLLDLLAPLTGSRPGPLTVVGAGLTLVAVAVSGRGVRR